jgi:hypothetical protein
VSDKNVVKASNLRFDPPNSAGALYQFLSRHPDEASVKLEGAYTAPVIKVRESEPKRLDTQSRDAWSFYLLNMQQAMAGTGRAQTARDVIMSLMATDKLKLSVGKLLGPVRHLVEAEQERLKNANSYVKRWIANERLVLEIAVPHDPDEQYLKKEVKDRQALQTACSVLSKFTNCTDGDIDIERIRDEAYAIGHSLPKDEIDALCSARMRFATRLNALDLYIGPEVPLLINLCIAAYGKSEKEFRTDTDTKTSVLNIMRILKARSDIDEYHTPTPPGTVADRKPRRLSMPVFAAPETTASVTSASTTAPATTASTTSTSTASTTPRHVTPETDSASANTAPPAKSPPPTPRRGSPGSEQNGTFSPPSTPRSDATDDNDRGGRFTPLSTSSPGLAFTTRYGGAGGAPTNMSAAINELRGRQHNESDATNTASSTLVSASLLVTPRRARGPGRPGSPFLPSSATTLSDSNTSTAKTPKPHSGRKRLDKANRSDANSPRQKSDGSETSSQRTRKPESSRRAKSMVFEQQGYSNDLDSSDQKALVEAGNAARALTADLLKPRTDSAFSKKWNTAEQQLQSVLTVETSTAIRRLMSYCHEVNLAQGNEQASLDRVIKYLKPMVKERNAYIAVRDILLAESRGAAETDATTGFPELLSLLVFAIDADHARRQERKAKSSH